MKNLKATAIMLALLLPCFALSTQAFGCDGRIVQVSTGNAVSVDDLTRRLEAVDALVLGERHGVAEHPVAAACLLSKLAEMRGLTLVLEHLRSDQQQNFDAYRHSHPEIAGGLGSALRWWESGWPSWAIYAPLFDALWRLRIPVIAGDQNRDLPDQERDALIARAGASKASQMKFWRESMAQSHCGLASDAQLDRLAAVQLARDIGMAERLLAAAGSLRVLYAGRSHARHDQSVPFLVRSRQVGVVAVAFQEVGSPEQNTKTINDSKNLYDFVWFVGVKSEVSPCEAIKPVDINNAKN